MNFLRGLCRKLSRKTYKLLGIREQVELTRANTSSAHEREEHYRPDYKPVVA